MYVCSSLVGIVGWGEGAGARLWVWSFRTSKCAGLRWLSGCECIPGCVYVCEAMCRNIFVHVGVKVRLCVYICLPIFSLLFYLSVHTGREFYSRGFLSLNPSFPLTQISEFLSALHYSLLFTYLAPSTHHSYHRRIFSHLVR